MIRSVWAKVTVVAAGVAVSTTTGSGVGAANPDDAALNTNCTYLQMVDAINTHSDETFVRFHRSIAAQTLMKRFIATPPYERAGVLEAMRGIPEVAPLAELLPELAAECKEIPIY